VDYQPPFFKHCDRTYYFKDGKPPGHHFGTINTKLVDTKLVAAGIDLKSVYITDEAMLEEDDSQLDESVMRMHGPIGTSIQSDSFMQVGFRSNMIRTNTQLSDEPDGRASACRAFAERVDRDPRRRLINGVG
jgi:hypothetical protein